MSILRADFFPKTSEEFKERTLGGAAISIGGLPGNGATDNMFAENTIRGNTNSWIVCSVLHNYTDCLAAPSNGALVGNHVLTSDTDDARSDRLLDYR